jgi:sterol desaturase/sphingolipid hydroxylase (fatty acid hydroxylase superfamily)
MHQLATSAYFYFPTIASSVVTIYLALKNPKSEDALESYVSLATSFFATLLFFGVLYLFPIMDQGRTFADSIHSQRLVNLPKGMAVIPLYILLADLWFYFVHRLSHFVPILWATHGVHHSATRMTTAIVTRTGLLAPFQNYLMALIPIYIGLEPFPFLFWFNLIQIHQTLCHNELKWPESIGKILVTPQFHRIHHSSASGHIDRNFGGLFTIWDRLFGTAVSPAHTQNYGIGKRYETKNPFRACSQLYLDVVRTIWKTRNPLYAFIPYREPNE